MSSTKTATSTKGNDYLLRQLQKQPNKTTLVGSDKEADVVNKRSQRHQISSLSLINPSSMDSHIKDTMKNIETFVRNLSAKNIQARLGLVEDMKTQKTKYILMDENFTK